jgi:hypothetical protein
MNLRRHLSFANIASALALTIAVSGGTAYAAGIARDSVGSPQLKKGAVTSVKVKDRSLKAIDFAEGQLPAGPQGPQGPAGPAGQRGVSSWDTIPSGQTVTGTIIYNITSGTTNVSDYVFTEFGALAPGAPTSVRFAPDGFAATPVLDESAACAGTPDNPTAPAGTVCIYPSAILGLDNVAPTGLAETYTRRGFNLQLVSDDDNADLLFAAIWAYRAP